MPTDAEVRAELARLLTYANARKVGDALGVSKATAARWARGETGRAADLEAVRRLLGTTKEPPQWAEALDKKVSATQATVERIGEMLGALAASLGSSPSPPPDGGSEDARAETRPGGRRGR